MDKKHIGSDFDDFLRDEGILDDAEAVATKRVIAYQLAQRWSAPMSRGLSSPAA